MTGPVIRGNLLDCVTVTDPVEVDAPKIGANAREGPAPSSNLAHERVVVLFCLGAATGRGVHGLEAGGSESFIKSDGAGVATGEEGDGSGRCGRVFRLHEDEGHGGFGPIGLDKGGQSAVVTTKEGVGGERCFKVVE